METVFTLGDFTLKIEERNRGDENYKGLTIITDGLAKKHVVEVRLDYVYFNMEGRDKQKYDNVYVSHGMRMKSDTLAETQEYIETLQQALEFAKQVEQYCRENDWWQD